MILFITLEGLTYIGNAEAWFPFIGKHAFLMERKSCDFLKKSSLLLNKNRPWNLTFLLPLVTVGCDFF